MSRLTQWRSRQRALENKGVFLKLGDVKQVHSDNGLSKLLDKGEASCDGISVYVCPKVR